MRYKQYLRVTKGTSILELVIGLTVLLPVCLYAVDLLALLFAMPVIESLAGSATRLASDGRPANLSNTHKQKAVGADEAPSIRATFCFKDFVSPCFLTVDRRLAISESIYEPLPSKPLGGPVFGEVTVKVRSKFTFPCGLPFLPAQLSLESQRTLPYTWNMPTDLETQ